MSSFGNLFHKKATPLNNLSVLKTDIHSHIIPGIDDGSKNIEESIELILKLKALGYKKIITTPHINYYYPQNTAEFIMGELKKLNEALKKKDISITIEAAAEYMIDDGFEEKFLSQNLLTFGKKYILIEFSYFFPPTNIIPLLFKLQIEGYKIVLAHPERYSYWHKSFDMYEDLKNRGVYFQLNMVSLTGIYSYQVRRIAEKLVEKNMIDFVGTDLHHLAYFNSINDCLSEQSFIQLLSSPQLLNNTL
jgi:protein-tyrosine phosphatase